MKKLLCVIPILLCILLAACGNDTDNTNKGENAMYEQITAEDAKKIMDSNEEHIILDVREQDEFDAGHIPGAILLPYTEIESKAGEIRSERAGIGSADCGRDGENRRTGRI